MPGTSRSHNLIVMNLSGEIWSLLRGKRGEVYTSDMRVRVGQGWRYTYPEISAVRDEPLLEDAELDTLLNPSMIAEVLSPSTENYDRGEKFAAYRQIESLQDDVLISQDRVRVELFTKRGEDWVRTELIGLQDVLRLESIGCDVPLSGIYAKTPFGVGQGEPHN